MRTRVHPSPALAVLTVLGVLVAGMACAAPSVVLASGTGGASGLRAQPVAATTGAGSAFASVQGPVRPELGWIREGTLLGGGAVLIGAAQLMDVTVKTVPPQGLDPADIAWSFDRRQIGKHDTRALSASDVASAAAMAYPVAVAFASQPAGERIGGTLRRSVVYLESFALATGVSMLIKNATDRPRPYTYLASGRRPADAAYDVTDREAFQSMPSSHACSAFCGAAFAVTDHLITRPGANWAERVGVSFTGGLLAGMTSTLRVEAGKHFPSDVLAGGAIGFASGVAVPITHRYLTREGRRAPLPPRRAWLQALGGMCAGVGAGILIAGTSY